MIECTYCKSMLKNQYTLKQHQNTAKYCLNKQGKINENFKCAYCNAYFSTSRNLKVHLVSCKILEQNLIKEKYETKISKLIDKIASLTDLVDEQKLHIKQLEDKLENVAIQAVSRPTTTNTNTINNYIQNMEIVTDEHLLEQAQYLTIDHVKGGVEGYAKYALEFPLKDRVACVDYARRKIKFKDNEGSIITDPEMGRLATKLFISIRDKNKDLIKEYIDQIRDSENFSEDDLTKIMEIAAYRFSINRGSEGEKDDFYHDFVKSVCSKTIVA